MTVYRDIDGRVIEDGDYVMIPGHEGTGRGTAWRDEHGLIVSWHRGTPKHSRNPPRMLRVVPKGEGA